MGSIRHSETRKPNPRIGYDGAGCRQGSKDFGQDMAPNHRGEWLPHNISELLRHCLCFRHQSGCAKSGHCKKERLMNTQKHPILRNKEKYEEIVMLFRTLTAQKALFKEKMKIYLSEANAPMSEKLSYRSSSNLSEVTGRGAVQREGPQAFQTYAFKDLEEEVIELGVYLADLEEALDEAIKSAVMMASKNQRPKIKRALRMYLIYGDDVTRTGVSYTTIKKYIDYAVIYAAENLDYVEKRTNKIKEKRNEIKETLFQYFKEGF